MLNAIVGAAGVAFAADVLGARLLTAAIGALAGLVSLGLSLGWRREVHIGARDRGAVLCPSPAGEWRSLVANPVD